MRWHRYRQRVRSNYQTDLSEFADIYGRYEGLTTRHSEMNATILVLEELRQWSDAIGTVETALSCGELEIARKELARTNDVLGSLEGRTRLTALLQKMRTRSEALSAEIREAFCALWDEMVSVQEVDDTVSLTATEDMSGTTPE
jgi:hypothetical protein